MKIGIVNVDSKIPNLALMKLSAWHKAQGDTVTLYSPLFDRPDRIYASKVFTDTPDYRYFPDCEIVKGGSGYDLHTELPAEVEVCCPDYSLFGCDYAIGFTSRGCIRNCPFCIVPEKEGRIRAVADIYQFWAGQEHMMLLDNNLTALPEHFSLIVGQLIKEQIKTDICQGLDIRLLTPDMAAQLAKLRLWKQLRFAWDDIRDEKQIRAGIKMLLDADISPRNIMVYVLIGHSSTPEEDLHRVEVLRSYRVDPYVMPYNRQDVYQRRFARWVNHKAIFKSVPWHKYKASA